MQQLGIDFYLSGGYLSCQGNSMPYQHRQSFNIYSLKGVRFKNPSSQPTL